MTVLIHDSYIQSIGDLQSKNSHLSAFGVPAQLVHRTYGRDVFVTAVRVVGPSRFEVTASLPAWHCFYGPVDDRHDPLLLLETVREAIFLVGHGRYEIPRHTSFIARDFEFDFDPAGLSVDDDGPTPFLIDVTTSDIVRRGNSVNSMRFDFTCYRDGEVVGTARYQISFASGAVYNRLRGEHRSARPTLMCDTAPVPPAEVGRTDDVDVLLAPMSAARGWHLRIDPDHPVIFDHVIDHVPSNALVEAARQACYLELGHPEAVLARGDMSFARYIEFDAPCLVVAEPTGQDTCVVEFTQNGETCAEGNLEFAIPRSTGA